MSPTIPLNPFAGAFDETGPLGDELDVQCPECNRLLPHDAFDLDERGQPDVMCRECRATLPVRCEEAERRRRRQGQLEAGIHRLIAAAMLDKPSVPSVESLCAELFKKFDGVQGLATEWKADHDAAKPGSKTRLDNYRAMVRLAEIAATSRKDELDTATVSEDELNDAVARYAFRVIHVDGTRGAATEAATEADCA